MAPTTGEKKKRTTSSKGTKDGCIRKNGTSDRITLAATKNIKEAYKANQKSSLLRLPGELRNKIYEYAIGSNEIEAFFTDDSHEHCKVQAKCYYGKLEGTPKDREQAWAKLFNLSLVCKALRKETKILPFSTNVFHAQPGHEFEVFLCELKPEYAAAIKTISLGDKWYTPCDRDILLHTLLRNLNKCTGLSTVIRYPTLNVVQMQLVSMLIEKLGLKVIDEKNAVKGWNDSWADYCEMMDDDGR